MPQEQNTHISQGHMFWAQTEQRPNPNFLDVGS